MNAVTRENYRPGPARRSDAAAESACQPASQPVQPAASLRRQRAAGAVGRGVKQRVRLAAQRRRLQGVGHHAREASGEVSRGQWRGTVPRVAQGRAAGRGACFSAPLATKIGPVPECGGGARFWTGSLLLSASHRRPRAWLGGGGGMGRRGPGACCWTGNRRLCASRRSLRTWLGGGGGALLDGE